MGLCHSSCRTRAEGGGGKASPCSHGAAFRLFLQKQLLSTRAHTGYSQPARGRLLAGTGRGASSPLGQRVRRPRKVLTARGMSSGHSAHRGQTFQRIPVFLTDPRPAPSSSDPPRSWLGGREERLFSDHPGSGMWAGLGALSGQDPNLGKGLGTEVGAQELGGHYPGWEILS